MNNFLRFGAAWLALLLLSSSALAHHSVAGNFDTSRTGEADGELVVVAWRNPHIQFTVRAVDANGVEQQWQLETNSVSVLSRLGLSEDLFKIGDHVRVFGNVGKRDEHALWTTNMLLSNGREVLLDARAEPRWSEETLGAPVEAEVTADPTGELGIFRVWTSVGGGGALWNRTYPLTQAAQAKRATWDPVADDPTKNCTPKGMPLMMEQPYPMQFVRDGDDVLMRLEEYDAVRRIVMRPGTAVQAPTPSRFGYSTGHWEDDRTLVVETGGIDYQWFDKTGIQQSNAVRMQERFSLTSDGSRLDYQLTVTDPATFTEPVVLSKAWAWRPGETIRPYNCVP
jgi:Family of unknown function (DUF6152)